jgi:hypothetical protein
VVAGEPTEDKSVSTDPVEDDVPVFKASTSRRVVDEVGSILEGGERREEVDAGWVVARAEARPPNQKTHLPNHHLCHQNLPQPEKRNSCPTWTSQMRKMNGMLMTLADGSNTISGKPAHSILLRSSSTSRLQPRTLATWQALTLVQKQTVSQANYQN